MMHLDSQEYDLQDGMTKTVIMSESSFFEKISAYLAENRLKSALEAEVKIMAMEANEETNHTKGPGVFFKPKPSTKRSLSNKNTKGWMLYTMMGLWDSRRIQWHRTRRC